MVNLPQFQLKFVSLNRAIFLKHMRKILLLVAQIYLKFSTMDFHLHYPLLHHIELPS